VRFIILLREIMYIPRLSELRLRSGTGRVNKDTEYRCGHRKPSLAWAQRR